MFCISAVHKTFLCKYAMVDEQIDLQRVLRCQVVYSSLFFIAADSIDGSSGLVSVQRVRGGVLSCLRSALSQAVAGRRVSPAPHVCFFEGAGQAAVRVSWGSGRRRGVEGTRATDPKACRHASSFAIW